MQLLSDQTKMSFPNNRQGTDLRKLFQIIERQSQDRNKLVNGQHTGLRKTNHFHSQNSNVWQRLKRRKMVKQPERVEMGIIAK